MKYSDTTPDRFARATIEYDGKEPKDFVKDVMTKYNKDVAAEEHNITPAREDIQFVIGDQWDARLRQRRQDLKKPTLTVNRLPAFIAQYLGSWQQTEQTMKLSPMSGGSKTIAEIRQGLMRTIVRTPIAKHATYTAMETAYICGVGNFGIELVDNKYDYFVKDMQLVNYDDPFQVIWDRSSREPTGADAGHCYAFHWMTKDNFQHLYPNKRASGFAGGELDYTTMVSHGWDIDEMIRVCHFWQMKQRIDERRA